jgi:hypothetical protein
VNIEAILVCSTATGGIRVIAAEISTLDITKGMEEIRTMYRGSAGIGDLTGVLSCVVRYCEYGPDRLPRYMPINPATI